MQRQIDAFLEERLADIDDFIQSELGFEPLSAAALPTGTDLNGLRCFLQTQELSSGSPNIHG